MTERLPTKYIRAIGVKGVIREASVDPALIPDGAVTDAVNVRFDRVGAAEVRPGLTTVGGTVTATDVYSNVGLHNSLQSTLIAVFSGGGSSRIYEFTSGAWATSLTGGTANVSVRFADFSSFTIGVNFLQNTLSSMVFWGANGGPSYWKTSGDPINPQNLWGYCPQLIEVFKSKVYVGGDTSTNAGSANFNSNPSRLIFSSVISSSGRITWSPTTDYVDINPGDGEKMTGLRRFSLELLVFKPNYIYRFRTSGVDPDPLIRVGTRSQESIVEGKRGLYFHHDSGFFRYSGGYPEEISRPIVDIVEAITFANYSSVASWKDNDHIYWSIGNITVPETQGNVTYNNAIARYTESSDVWTIYSTPKKILRGSPFINATSSSIVIGTNHGVVGEFNKGQTDFGEPINYRLVTNWFEDGIETRKRINQLVAICEKASGMGLMYQIDEKVGWEPIGQLTKMINYMDSSHLKSTLFTDRFHRIRFKVTGVSTKEPPMFRGLHITEWFNEGITKEV